MKAIYRLNFSCGRQGSLEGIFTADQEAMRELIKSGKEIYFGEVLGKHSEICGPIEEQDIEVVTDDQNVVAMFELHDFASGYNPFDYINDDDEDEIDEE